MNMINKRKPIPDRTRPGSTTSAHTTSSQGGGDKCATGKQTSLKLRRNAVIAGTWNVRTLYAAGKIEQLEHELKRYTWNIIGIAEARLTGVGESRTPGGNRLYHSGQDRKHASGTAFLIHKDIADTVMEFKPISDRVIYVRLNAKPFNLSVMQIYAPTSEATDEQMNSFYDEVTTTLQGLPKQDIHLLMGDWNAKIGPDAYDQWKGTIGHHGLGVTNDRGLRLLEFAKFYELTICNTFQKGKRSRKATWHSPDGRSHNMIDYIMVGNRFRSSINLPKTRTFPGADVGSDHDLVLTSLNLRLKNIDKKQSKKVCYNLDSLKDRNIVEQFQAEVGGRFAPLLTMELEPEEFHQQVEENLRQAAVKVLGKRRPRKQKSWLTDSILQKCDERRQLKQTRFNSPQDSDAYRASNKDVRKEVNKAKENWIQHKCNHIESSLRTNNTKAAYDTVKELTQQKMSQQTCIEDANGTLLSEKPDILKRWHEYCSELYNYQISAEREVLQELKDRTADQTEDDPEILECEVEAALKALKHGKSPGIDNIPAELLAYGGESVVKAYTRICNRVFKTGNWPKDWTTSIVIPLPKKGNLKKCNNYRTISLISHPSKILLKVILKRLQPQAEAILSEEQAGFRKGRSTSEQIFNLRVLCEKYRQLGKPVYHNFVDYKKCFDRIWQEGLWAVLRRYHISAGLINCIEALYASSSSLVRIGEDFSECFPTSVGVRQGCLLSPTLCNIFLENIMAESEVELDTPLKISGRVINNLRFADDIDLLHGSSNDQTSHSKKVDKTSGRYGMEISLEKTKTMVASGHEQIDVCIRDYHLEQVAEFVYLGSTQTEDGTSLKEVKVRIAKATSTLARLKRIWRDRNISMQVKLQLLRSLVISVFLYASESWTMNTEIEKRINAFELNCYRRLLNIHYTSHTTNVRVKELVIQYIGKHDSLLSIAKKRKLRWFGHVTRAKGTLANIILQGTVDGSRKRGRPKRIWIDDIKDWTGRTVGELLRLAEDRAAWSKMIMVTASPQWPHG